MLADGFDTDLVRLQCYEGLTAESALYEWNYPRQMLAIRQAGDAYVNIYADDYLISRPMLEALRHKTALTSLALARPATGQVPAADIGRLAEITRHHVSLIDPARVLLMGEAVNRALFGSESGTNRGILHAINHQERHFPTIASYHPRFLIRRPVAKADSWKHLQLSRTFAQICKNII